MTSCEVGVEACGGERMAIEGAEDVARGKAGN